MQQPNVIWIISDQHRAQCLGCDGDLNVRTPHLDRLAAKGLRFHRAVSTSPICSPARAALLTSRYPHQNGVPINGCRMSGELPTVATAFAEHGYRTAWFGKWHVDAPHLDAAPGERKYAGEYRVARERRGGFECWLGYENVMNPDASWVHGHDESGSEVEPFPLDGFDTDALTDLMLAYLQRRGREQAEGAGRPFFAAVSYFAPHDPYIAPARWLRRYRPGDMRLRPNVPDVRGWQAQRRCDLAGYCAMVEQIDHNVGRIVRLLERTGQLARTHVLYFSDHGDMLGSHGLLRKGVPHEEALRIPLIVGGETSRYSDWDGRGGGLCDVPASHVDIAPTSLGLCGLEAPSWMAGADLSGYRIASRPKVPLESACAGIWRPMTWDGLDWPWRCVVTRDGWKYTSLNGQPYMMTNVNDDPYERVNLIPSQLHKAQRRRLHSLLVDWIRRTGDGFPLSPPSEA